jgi:hypothetical protein
MASGKAYNRCFVTVDDMRTPSRRHPLKPEFRLFGSTLILAAMSFQACSLLGLSTVPHAFTPAQPLAPADFSHQSFEDLLHAHVRDGLVDYPAIASDSRLDTYLQQLDRLDPSALPSRDHRLAFWINAYNAFAIKGILNGESPRRLWGRYRYFIGRQYRIGGEGINLYDLERRVLIPDFHEPRIHFAIVCASRSCPKLQRVFSPERLDAQLDEAARTFINDASRNRFDREGKVAELSMIFKWFARDFKAAGGSLLAYVRQYVADPELARELANGRYTVSFLEYDWSLNGRPPIPMETRMLVYPAERQPINDFHHHPCIQ